MRSTCVCYLVKKSIACCNSLWTHKPSHSFFVLAPIWKARYYNHQHDTGLSAHTKQFHVALYGVGVALLAYTITNTDVIEDKQQNVDSSTFYEGNVIIKIMNKNIGRPSLDL